MERCYTQRPALIKKNNNNFSTGSKVAGLNIRCQQAKKIRRLGQLVDDFNNGACSKSGRQLS